VRRTWAACLAATLALVAPAAASAISLSGPSTATTSVTLSGFDQTVTFNTALTISAPGGNGWNITAWAPKPTHSTSTLSALYVATRPTTSCAGGGCVNASPTLSWPVTLGTASGGAVKIINAAKPTGNGTSDTVTVPFSVDLRADTRTGAYTTTITLAIVSGP
jgi:hypothetical protein